MKTQENQEEKDAQGQKATGRKSEKQKKSTDQGKKKEPDPKDPGGSKAGENAEALSAEDQDTTLYEEIKKYSQQINKTVKALLKRKE